MIRIDLGEFNCYLVLAREGFVLVDAGRPERRQMLAAALQRAGCRRGYLGLVVVTRGDYDHAGNALWVRTEFGARIAVHRDDVERVEPGDSRVGFEPRPDRVSRIFKEVSRRVETADSDVLEPDIYPESGQSLSQYGFDATVLRLRGHRGDATAILMSEGGLASFLFVSDMGVAKAKRERATFPQARALRPSGGVPRVREVRGGVSSRSTRCSSRGAAVKST